MSTRKGGRAARIKSTTPTLPLIDKGAPNYTRPPAAERVCVIACGALAHEILDIIAINQLDHIALTCLPAKLHNQPDAIPKAVEKAIHDARAAGFTHIFCGYGDCGTGGHLDAVLKREQVERLPGAHCYAFFSGVDRFQQREEEDMRAFFLTDFLARHFDGLTWEPLGLNRHPELRDAYFGAYEKVVYLAQNNEPALVARAQEIAERLGLQFDVRHTGYGELEEALISYKK